MTSRSTSSRPVAASARPRAPRKGAFGGTLIGLFLGVIVGLGIAAGAAYYLMKSGNPYQPSTAKETPRDAVREPAKGKADAAAPEKPRFDFYKILPGAEEAKVQPKAPDKSADRATLERAKDPSREPPARDATAKEPDRTVARADDRAASKPPAPVPPAAKAGERFWLQAGSFAGESDAENLKARLALAGWEAVVQKADIADKGTRYRVRLGPYDNTDELTRNRAELGKRGFEVAVIRQ